MKVEKKLYKIYKKSNKARRKIIKLETKIALLEKKANNILPTFNNYIKDYYKVNKILFVCFHFSIFLARVNIPLLFLI